MDHKCLSVPLRFSDVTSKVGDHVKFDEASPFFHVNLCQHQKKEKCNEYYHEDNDILFIPMYFCQILIEKSAYYLII